MLNKVMLIGHLGKDPEIRATQSADALIEGIYGNYSYYCWYSFVFWRP